ncbi:DUF4253 domain-containing protein [Actinoplanes utahensis]|uniref:DUF4253 domain-containing protein n=1 Tax=Actinoplanes utahensis TaxID=1869 RepID=UPI000690CB79|nr:DUF4253 domain-containing protein [Actinoplanes utahensis]GIF27286.1 hypothetical protein Aut01nite_02720 [Actinoplanes utahensis]
MAGSLAGLSWAGEAVTPGGVRLLSADVPPDRADEIWRELLEQHPATGLYPVLGPDAAYAAELAGRYPTDVQGPAALAEALTVDPAARFEQLRRAAIAEGASDGYEGAAACWEATYDPARLAARLDGLTGPGPGVYRISRNYPPTSVLLVPATAGYEVPVLVPALIRANNTDLRPVDHLAVLRHWHQRYGAELYHPAGSTLELDVARPPVTTEDVARCAVEQAVYCFDLILQILGEPEDIARKQARGTHWSFWWD